MFFITKKYEFSKISTNADVVSHFPSQGQGTSPLFTSDFVISTNADFAPQYAHMPSAAWVSSVAHKPIYPAPMRFDAYIWSFAGLRAIVLVTTSNGHYERHLRAVNFRFS